MAQESDSDSDSIPMGRPGGMEDDMIFVPVMANEVDMDNKRATITQNTGQASLSGMAFGGGGARSGRPKREEKYDTDDEVDDNPTNNQANNDEKEESSHIASHRPHDNYSRSLHALDENDLKDANNNPTSENTNKTGNSDHNTTSGKATNANDGNNTGAKTNGKGKNSAAQPDLATQPNLELNSYISEPTLARVEQKKLVSMTSDPQQTQGKRIATNHPLSDNNLGLPMQHHTKESSIGYSISSDFHRDTKWDVVYLTSSPLVFGSGTYKPLDQLNIKEEREQFFSTLKQSGKELKVIHNPATTSNIIAAVTGGSKCIHYSGHGYPNYLAFEDAKRIGETHLVHYDLIRRVCEDEDQRIEFVFASACHSEHVGQAFIEAGIPHVVAVKKKWEVTDEAAACFTKHFYDTLLNGFTILKAFQTAKNAVGAMSSSARLDQHKFLLLPEDLNKKNNRHDVKLFDKLLAGDFKDDTKATPPNNLPPAVQQFVGRAIDMRHIIHQLMDNGVRLLILTGDHGIGKSATSLMVGRYFCDRRMFKGGLFFIDVPKMLNSFDTQHLSQMLLRAFRESGDPAILAKFGKKGDMSESEIFNNMRHMGEMLLVFDGLDNFNLGGNGGAQRGGGRSGNQSSTNRLLQTKEVVQSFLQNVFDRTNVETKVLVTSEKKLHTYADFTGCISRYYKLRPLKPKDAAILFSRLANQFRHTDIVSHSRLMHLLECNPLKIAQVVQLKHQFNCTTLEKIVDAFETKKKIESHPQAIALRDWNKRRREKTKKRQELADTNIQNPKAKKLWLAAKGMEIVQYTELHEVLQKHFSDQTGSVRKLMHAHLIEPCRAHGLLKDLTFPIDRFDQFYLWFEGLCQLVKVLAHVWNETDPVLIHGFVSRSECEQKLQASLAGTFIIRFSTSQAKSIAISYRETDHSRHKNNVTHLKASLAADNNFQFDLRSEHTLRPMSLDDFIRKYKKIEYLYEDSGTNRAMLRQKHSLHFGPNAPNNQQQQKPMQTHMQIPQTQQIAQGGQGQNQNQHYTMQNAMSYPGPSHQQQQAYQGQQQQQNMGGHRTMYNSHSQQPYAHQHHQQQHQQQPQQHHQQSQHRQQAQQHQQQGQQQAQHQHQQYYQQGQMMQGQYSHNPNVVQNGGHMNGNAPSNNALDPNTIQLS